VHQKGGEIDQENGTTVEFAATV
jgi:hypothetical protein